jgi:hypothetical protein
MDFFIAAILWCGLGFLSGLGRKAALEKDGYRTHPAQLAIDTAFGPLSFIGFLRNGGWPRG